MKKHLKPFLIFTVMLGFLLSIGLIAAKTTYAKTEKFSTKLTKISNFLKNNKRSGVEGYLAKTIKFGPFGSEYVTVSKQKFYKNYIKAYRFQPIYAKSWSTEKWNNNFWGIQEASKTRKRGLIVARLLDKKTREIITSYGENEVLMLLVTKKNGKVKIIAGLISTESILKDFYKIIE